jgi:protein required for attachment to host cells
MSVTWIVVADSSRARIFSAEKPISKLVEVQALTHPEGRLHQGDLVTDKPGRDNNASYGSHNMGHETDAKEEESLRFAAMVCERLEEGRCQGQYEKLYVIAAPTFLGLLRKQQNSALRKTVADEIPKNLSTHTPAEIRKVLPRYL